MSNFWENPWLVFQDGGGRVGGGMRKGRLRFEYSIFDLGVSEYNKGCVG